MKLRRLLYLTKHALFRKTKPSLDGIDDKLRKYLDFKNGFFIEAGANDGYSRSNTYYLEKKLGWTGLLVEGIPELYVKCVKRRPNSVVIGCALVKDDQKGKTVTMRFAHLMSLVDGAMNSTQDEENHISSGLTVQHLEESYEVEVPARTLEDVLNEVSNLPQIDFFSLDVEGMELDVLVGLNLDKYRPRFLLVEARYFEEVDSYLSTNGYELVERMSHHDYFYKDIQP